MGCYWIHHAKALEKWTNSTGQINGGFLVKWGIKCRFVFFLSRFKKHIGKKNIDEFSSKWGTQLCSDATSYEVACCRLRDNRVLENTNSWEPGTGFIWGGKFMIANGCHVRPASLVCHHVRKSCSRRYHEEFIFLCDFKKKLLLAIPVKMWQHHHTKRLLGKFKKKVSITALVGITLLPEYLMEFCKATLTFESADEILWCAHSNESSLPVFSHGAICFSICFEMWKFGWKG